MSNFEGCLMKAFGATDLEASCYSDDDFYIASRQEFMALTEIILELAGAQREGWFYERKNYQDLVIAIESREIHGKREVEVERLADRNPVVMATDGEVIRFHGHHLYLVPHMKALVRRLVMDHATTREID